MLDQSTDFIGYKLSLMATVCIIFGFVVMGLILNAFELLACHTTGHTINEDDC